MLYSDEYVDDEPVGKIAPCNESSVPQTTHVKKMNRRSRRMTMKYADVSDMLHDIKAARVLCDSKVSTDVSVPEVIAKDVVKMDQGTLSYLLEHADAETIGEGDLHNKAFVSETIPAQKQNKRNRHQTMRHASETLPNIKAANTSCNRSEDLPAYAPVQVLAEVVADEVIRVEPASQNIVSCDQVLELTNDGRPHGCDVHNKKTYQIKFSCGKRFSKSLMARRSALVLAIQKLAAKNVKVEQQLLNAEKLFNEKKREVNILGIDVMTKNKCLKKKDAEIAVIKEKVGHLQISIAASLQKSAEKLSAVEEELNTEIENVSAKLQQPWRIFGKKKLRQKKNKLLRMKENVSNASAGIDGGAIRLDNFDLSQ